MKYRENVRHELDRRAKIIIVSAIVLSFAVVMIPLWQKGAALSLNLKTVIAEEKIENLEKEERALLSSLSEIERSGYKEEVALAIASI